MGLLVLAILSGLSCVTAFAQAERSTTYAVDINGRRIEGFKITEEKTAGASIRSETVQSINGRQIPLERTEEKVISDVGGVRVVERVFKRFDQNGRLASTEKTRIEERKNPDGSVNSTAVVTRSNINGGWDPYERRTTSSSKSGDTVTSNTAVERQGVNGSFEPAERVEEVRRDAADGTGSIRAVIQRRDLHGRYFDWQRTNSERTRQNGTLLENSATYGSVEHGDLQLLRQTVSRTDKQPNGAESTQIEIYEVYEPGRPKTSEAPKLREVQFVERTPVPGGMTETVSIRQPLPNDPKKLGTPQVLSQTICSGECK